ncbi:ferrous iron transport protein B [bacterium]|nr:ferrous iron transport protein B [bacterium]
MIKSKFPDIVFIGQPNSGKSTLFNAVAGLKAETSNFPGTTVKHSHSKVRIKGQVLNIIDLPGSYSLNPSDAAEKVSLRHIFLEKPEVIINVVDASILGRSLELTLELIEMGYPMVVALNMMDLAEKKGVRIDIPKLEKLLGVEVIPTIASHGRGVKEVLDKAVEVLEKPQTAPSIRWSKDVEDRIQEFEEQIPLDFPMVANKRFSAVKMIEAGKLYFDQMLKSLNPALKKSLDGTRKKLEKSHSAPAYEVIAAERHHAAMKIFEESSEVKRGGGASFLEKVDDLIMHPVMGYFVLLAVFLGFFFIIFQVGSPVEELLLNPLNNLRDFLSLNIGGGLFYYILDGFIQGVGGGIAIVLPYFIPLLFLMSLLEDAGYLARAGFLMDTFMHKIGLHGKSVSPFILGFGCNVPAIVSTRILESKRDKIITSLLIPFIPCSARTTVILALVAFYLGPLWALGFYVVNIFLVGVIGRLLTLFFKMPSPGLILEIPSLKFPSLKNIAQKTYIHLRSFVKFAWPLLIVGSVILGLMQYFRLDQGVNLILAPLVENGLGLPRELGVTLVFGFLRKELSLIMMLQALGVEYQNLLTMVTQQQLVVFTVFINFFIPCLSTVAIIWKEIGKKIAFLSIVLNTGVAVLLSLVVRLLFGI